MKNIIVTCMAVRNFMSVGHEQSFSFNEHALTLVTGANGTGKSTIKEALNWGFYGTPYRAAFKQGDLSCRFNPNQTTSVTIEFTILGREYTLTRTMNPSSFEVYCDGVQLWAGEKNMKEVQKNFEHHVLRMKKSTFQNITMQSIEKEGSFPTLSPKDRRTFLEDVLDMHLLNDYQSFFSGERKKAEERVRKAAIDVRLAEQSLRSAEEHNRAFEAGPEITIQKKKLLIEMKNEEIKRENEALSAFYREYDEDQKKLLDYASIDKDIEATKRGIHDAEKKIKDAEKAMAFYSSHQECPECSQSITAEFRRTATEDLEAKVGAANLELKKLKAILAEQNTKLKTKSDLVRNSMRVDMEAKSSKRTIAALEEIVRDAHDAIEECSKMEKKDIAALKQELDQATLRKTRGETTMQIAKTCHEMCSEEQARAVLLRLYLPHLNYMVNDIAHKLGFNGQVKLHEDCELEIRLHGQSVAFETCSRGEKMRIGHAFLFAWRDLAERRSATSCNILIQDETVDASLDNQGVDDYFRFLREHLNDDNIIIISHSPTLMSYEFDRHVSVEKQRGNTRYVEK